MDDDFGFSLIDLPAFATVSQAAAVEYLVGQLVELGQIRSDNAPQVAREILQRETLGSTGIGRAVAVPHIESAAVKGVVGLIGRSATGIPWPGVTDGVPVRVVAIFVYPVGQPGAHLETLKKLAIRLRGFSEEGPHNSR